MKRIGLILLAIYALVVVGCNTIAGVGADLGAAGDKIEEKATEEKGY
jgi:predicted small secreted protein